MKKPEKNQGFNGIRTRDLRDTGAMLYQLSYEATHWEHTSLPMCGFIAQLVEHRTGIAEVTGSNPVEALIFFRLLHSNCLNWKFTAKITYHLHIYPQFIYESFHILHVKNNSLIRKLTINLCLNDFLSRHCLSLLKITPNIAYYTFTGR